jgi:hypothetical protein
MKGRGQALAAALVALLVVAGGLYLQREVGAKAPPAAAAEQAPSGAWFCPHGGGRDWAVTLEVANPGPDPVPIRVRSLSGKKPGSTTSTTVEPGTEVLVPVRAEDRGASSVVEYFGGWVAAGWVSHAGGGEGGVGAEPCLSDAGRRWLLPDGTTTEHEDSYVVVMNPFATDAVVSLTLLSEKRVVNTGDLSNVPIKPYRSVAFHLNATLLDEITVATIVDVKIGRVAAASLGVSDLGGVRSAVGILGDPPAHTILPGGFDQGRTDLEVMNTTADRVALAGTLLLHDAEQPIGGLAEASPAGESAQTIPVTTDGPTTVDLRPEVAVAAARRTYGTSSDQGATTGASAAGRAWIVLPAVAGSPSHAGLVLANPGDVAASVTLRFIPSGTEPPPAPVTVQIPAHRTVAAPEEWAQARPLAAVLAVASSGTFVPAAASYSLGREGYATFAVSLGVPIPDRWVPS